MNKISFDNRKPRSRRNKQNIQDVIFNHDIVLFYCLSHYNIVSKFLRGIDNAIRSGISDFTIDFSNVGNKIFPNVAGPIAGILFYYQSQGINFKYTGVSHAIEKTNIFASTSYKEGPNILNKVWEFTADDIGIIVNAYSEGLSRMDRYPKGFLAATEWALYEVMDNVIQHSNVSSGYVMGQVHPSTHHIAFTVFDLGQGIYNSLQNSSHHPENEADAISLAIQESVTRDESIGQGNGLFGLSSLIKQGDSRLNITSGKGFYSYAYGNPITRCDCPVISKKVNMTTVDFMLDYSKDISLRDALIFNGEIHTPISFLIDNLKELDGNTLIKVKEESNGTGTRQAAVQIKNKVLNILKESPKIIVLDFTGISMISSSYADELLAKLFCDLGLFQFNRVIRIIGLSDEQQLILQRSVIQRIIEDYNIDSKDVLGED